MPLRQFDEGLDLAVWEDGDPPFDIDGEDRPNTDSAMEVAGADAP